MESLPVAPGALVAVPVPPAPEINWSGVTLHAVRPGFEMLVPPVLLPPQAARPRTATDKNVRPRVVLLATERIAFRRSDIIASSSPKLANNERPTWAARTGSILLGIPT